MNGFLEAFHSFFIIMMVLIEDTTARENIRYGLQFIMEFDTITLNVLAYL